MTQSKPLICIGHRGAMGYKPENTLSSFKLALDMGCPWVELDVYTLEGQLIVIHDDTLDRTTSGHGKLEETPLPALRALDAGDGQQVPLLREVIELVDRRAGINVELKGKGTAAPVSLLLNEYVQRGWEADQFLISSFDHAELAAADPTFRRGALFGRRPRSRTLIEAATSLGAWSINIDVSLATRETVEEAHGHGFKVFVYTVNEPADIQRMREVDADGVFTNFPDRVISGQ